MIVYRGFRRHKHGPVVTRDGVFFEAGPSRKVWDHSPDGFEWGYGGSGPAQLALALLLDVTGNADEAVLMHQRFKDNVVAGWRSDGRWEITDAAIRAWLLKAGGPRQV